jgi:hypothetical protein
VDKLKFSIQLLAKESKNIRKSVNKKTPFSCLRLRHIPSNVMSKGKESTHSVAYYFMTSLVMAMEQVLKQQPVRMIEIGQNTLKITYRVQLNS